MDRRTSNRLLAAGLATALLAASPRATNWYWDCSADAGYQPCNGRMEDPLFTTDGMNSSSWVEGSNLVLPATTGSWTITVEASHVLGRVNALDSGYEITGGGAFAISSTPMTFQVDTMLKVSLLISGNGGLEKTGVGILELAKRNTYAGATMIRAGTLRVSADGVLGDTVGTTTLLTGSVLDLNGRSLGGEEVVLDGGRISNQRSDEGDAIRKLRVASGSATIGGTANIVFKRGTSRPAYFDVDAGATFTKTDTTEFALDGMPVVNEGVIAVSEGMLHSYGGTSFTGSGTVRVDSGARWLVNPDASGAVMGNALDLDGGVLNVFGDSAAGAVGFTGNVHLARSSSRVNALSPVVFRGGVSGDGTLTKWGSAPLVLAADNPFTGKIVGQTGTVRIGDGGATGSVASDTIHDGVELVFDHTGIKAWSGVLTGTGRLVKRGSGVQVFTGTSPFTGVTEVEAGKIDVTGSLRSDTVRVRAGGALGGTGSIGGLVEVASGGLLDPGEHDAAGDLHVGSLFLAAGARLSSNVGKSSNRVIVSGSATLSGTIDLEAGSGIEEGSYILVASTGAMTTSGLVLGAVPRGFKATLETGANSVVVSLRIENAELFRDCSDSAGLQPCGGKWSDTAFSADSVHLLAWPGVGNRAVLAGPDGSYQIEVTGTVVVDSLVFRASGYRLFGDTLALAKGIRVEAGKIDTLDTVVVVGGKLVFGGGGTLVVSNSPAQAFGPLEITSGTFVVSRRSNAPAGNKLGTGSVTVAAGAVLDLDSLVQGDNYGNTLYLNGSGTGDGALRFTENRHGANWQGPIILQGDAVIGSRTAARSSGRLTTISGAISGAHALELRSERSLLRASGAISVGKGLTIRGPDTVELAGTNTYTGNTTIASGILRLSRGSAIPHGAGKGDVGLAGRIELADTGVVLNGLSGTGTIDVVSGDTLVLSVGDADRSSDFSGTLRNSAGRLGLAKIGTGTLTISGNAMHGGGTRVKAGSLIVDGTCDSGTIAVGVAGTLGGNGSVGRVVLDSGRLRPGTADGIAELAASSVDASGGAGSTIALRVRGRTSPGADHDRLTVSGALVLGGTSTLDLDLQGLAATDTGMVLGVVRAGSISGTFATVNVLHAARHSVSLRYASDAIDVLVGIIPYVISLDTLLHPTKDSIPLTLGNGVTIVVPGHDGDRTVFATIDDSILGHGISGADTAVVVQPGTAASGPLVVRAPLELVPASKRLAGEVPSVFRLDSAGRVRVVPATLRGDSTLEYVVTMDGATWLGYDTVPPVVVATWSRDSLGPADTAVVGFRLEDNVVGTEARSCLLRAGTSAVVCSTLATGDSTHGERPLTRSHLPLGGAGWIEARDTRSTAKTESVDLVAAIDTLRADSPRLEDRYELVSFPCIARDRTAHDLFRELWGEDDARRWRAFRRDSAGFSEVLSGDTANGCGRAFWVRTRGVERRSRVVGGWSVPVSVPVSVVLAPGWNMVGDPYGFDLDWEQVRSRSGLDTLDVQGPYLYDGAEGNWSLPDSTSSLPAWRGVAVRNSTGREVTLRLPSIPERIAAARRQESRPSLVRIALRASQEPRRSSWVRMGIEGGGRAMAARVQPLPPAPMASLGAYLAPRGVSAVRQLLSDIRVGGDSSQEWTLRIEGLAPKTALRMEVSRTGIDTAASAWILDEKASRWLVLGAGMEFAVGDETMRQFRIVVGRQAPSAVAVERLALVVRAGRIRWSIPADMGRVRARIESRSLDGRLQAVLVDETLDPGTYERPVADAPSPATRIVVLRAGGRIETVRSAGMR